MALAAEANDLMDLARSRAPADRERLLDQIIVLCDNAGDAVAQEAMQRHLESIFMLLAAEAERDIRQRLSEKIAPAAWAPSSLVNMLVLDEIEIAAPLIAQSPVLQDHDLIRLLVESTLEHQIAVARRGKLSATVVEAILQQDEPAVLTALAGNDTAQISEDGMGRMVERSHRVAAMRLPLSRHPRLSSEHAQRLYLWVGQALRQSLTSRFRLDPSVLDGPLAEAVHEAFANPGPAETLANLDRIDAEESERRLVEKLYEAGQLRPGYLLRMLREGRLSVFVLALAKLGKFDALHIRRAIDSDRPELLALACIAVGIDRGAFPTILHQVQSLNRGKPAAGGDALRRASGAFGPFDADIAAKAFRQTIGSV